MGYGLLEPGDIFTPASELVPGLLGHPHFKAARSGKKNAVPESTHDEPEEAFATH